MFYLWYIIKTNLNVGLRELCLGLDSPPHHFPIEVELEFSIFIGFTPRTSPLTPTTCPSPKVIHTLQSFH